MNGSATIEIAPTLPDFAVQHATRKNMQQSTLMPPPAPSQQMFTYPFQYAPPQYYPHYNPYMISESLIPPSSEITIPSVKEFLKKLDKDEGDNGDFVQFIDAFNEQKITVKHIKDLDNSEFQLLAVSTID